jgi:hypothetical protein
MVFLGKVRRGIHIAISLMAVLLLVKPFDCFDSGQFTQKAADCCKKGKCNPANGDDCCKGTLPGGKQLVASTTPHHAGLTLDAAATVTLDLVEPAATMRVIANVAAPPGSPPTSRLNLPLLI